MCVVSENNEYETGSRTWRNFGQFRSFVTVVPIVQVSGKRYASMNTDKKRNDIDVTRYSLPCRHVAGIGSGTKSNCLSRVVHQEKVSYQINFRDYAWFPRN